MELIIILAMIFVFMLATGGITIIAFLVGARTAQKADKGEEIELPNINPMQAYREHREKVEASKEQERFNIMMENINNYSGDGLGQKDIL